MRTTILKALMFVSLVLGCRKEPQPKPESGLGPEKVGFKNALQFDGVDDYVDYGDILDDLAFPLTISAWINLSADVPDWAPIFISQDNESMHSGLKFIVKPTQLCIAFGDGTGGLSAANRRTYVSNIEDLSGKWVYVTGVIEDPTTLEVYVDGVFKPGVLAGTTNLPMGASANEKALTGLWNSNGVAYRFKGGIDEIRIWDRALTASQINSFRCQMLEGTNLEGMWKFDETTGNTTYDNSPRHSSGTLNGATFSVSGAGCRDLPSVDR